MVLTSDNLTAIVEGEELVGEELEGFVEELVVEEL